LSRERWGELALVATCAVWGLTFAMVQDAVAELPVPAFLAYRFLAAALLVGIIFRRSLAALDAASVRAGAVMGAFLAAGYLLQTYALQHTTVSNAGFLTGLFTPLTPLLGALVLRARPAPTALFAAGLATVGVALLSGVGGEGLHPLGDALAVGCAACFAGHILATDRGIRAHPARDVAALLAVQLAVVGGICLAAAAALGQIEAPSGTTVWTALIVTTVFASAGGFFAQTYAQQYTPPARVALILALEPVFAGLFGWLLVGDTLGVLGFAGAGLILVAIVAIDLVPKLRPPRPLPEG
jgi:drug/metabolite transporter (DMT)-like permease